MPKRPAAGGGVIVGPQPLVARNFCNIERFQSLPAPSCSTWRQLRTILAK